MATPDPDSTPAAASARVPIVLKITVPCSPERAFAYFTRDIGRWWPLASHSCGEERAHDVRLEPRPGGAIVETERDGITTHRWGVVSAWTPGERVAFSWHPGRDESTAQWVEVTFVAHPAGTLVTLTHGGFERLGDRGPGVRTAYENGWATVLGQRYADYCAQPQRKEAARR